MEKVLMPILTCNVAGIADIGPTRRALCRALHERRAGDDQVDAVALVASELMTNAIMYGTPPLAISISTASGPCESGPVTVAVSDHGELDPVRRDPGTNGRPGGYGLNLVSAASSSWGVRPIGEGAKEVWAVVPAE
jgi:anti-sigma regulatory factor (Ser/Thr protein kinase)